MKNFKWMSEREFVRWEEGKGCILEVDFEYFEGLYDLYNDYFVVSESVIVNGVEKLISNFNFKNYVVYGENLKKYLDLGLKLTKIYRGIKFDELFWFKSYIEKNMELRKRVKNFFEKDFFKLVNNSVFGKTMENIRKRVDVKLVNGRKRVEKLVAKFNYKFLTIFDENFIVVYMKRTRFVIDKFVYVGMSIFNLSKILMYDFYYGYIKEKY